MGLKPGQTNNPHGRPRGSQNKVNKELRELVHDFLSKKMSKIDEIFDKLTPREQARFITDLLGYVMPKLQPVEQLPVDKTDNSLSLMQTLTEKFKDYESKKPIGADD